MSPLNVNLSGNCVSFNPIYHKPKPPKNRTPGKKKYGFTNKIKQSLYDTAIYGLIKTKQKNSHFYFITLTYRESKKSEASNKHISEFLEYLDKKESPYKRGGYVWIKENTKKETPHFHLLIDLQFKFMYCEKSRKKEAYKDKTGKAPSGWKTSPEDSPSKGEVWTVDDQSKWEQEKVAKDAADKAATDQAAADKEKKADADKQKKIDKEKEKGQKDKAQRDKRAAGKQSLGKVDKEKQAALKQKLKDKRAKAAPEEFQKFALHELIGLSTEDRTQLLEELVLEETMSLEESQELQAIMALDDAGIKADINRKGQVVIKKKDKKKAHIALEKSFKKGGWPPLKLEDVDEHKGTEPHKHPHEDEELDEASSKKARNKAADEIEKIADKGGAEAPTLFSLASKLRKGTHSTTGLKLSKQVTSILKDNGIKEEVDLNTYQEMKMSMAAKKKRALWAKTAAGKKSAKKSKIRAKKVRAGSIKIDKAKGRKMAMARKKGGIRDAYEIVSEARNRAKENKPEWETEDSRLS